MDNTTSCDQLSLKNKTSQKALKFAHTVRNGVTDVVKSNGKTLSASTANSVGMKDVKNKNSDDTIYRKTTDCISREKLNVLRINELGSY